MADGVHVAVADRAPGHDRVVQRIGAGGQAVELGGVGASGEVIGQGEQRDDRIEQVIRLCTPTRGFDPAVICFRSSRMIHQTDSPRPTLNNSTCHTGLDSPVIGKQ